MSSHNGINGSSLTVTSLVLSSPTSNSFHLLQNSTIGNPSRYHPQLDAFNASLALDGGNPYAYIQIPAIRATRQAISIVDQDVAITDLAAFTAYNEAVLNNEEVKVDVNGRTGLHEGRLPTTTVDYRKTATMKGMKNLLSSNNLYKQRAYQDCLGLNKLTGFNVTSFEIKLEPEEDGTNMVGEVLIPNPSVLTLSMGNVTFLNNLPATPTTPRTEIGTSTLTNLILRPGPNNIPMRSVINQTLVIQAISSTYKDGMLPVEIVGKSAVYEGQSLSYFEKALQGLTQKVVLDVGSALKEVGLDPAALAAFGGGE
ncbi:MAG: hypothetical protein Q9164_002841 [Protoblastenia rupestris]